MARRGERDRGKERFWRRVLRQWRGSGQSVRVFCATHQLSEASFYGWRRTIAARQRQAAPRRGGRAAADETLDTGVAGRRSRALPVFVPVRLAAPPAAPLEVVLRDSRVVRVPAGFDAATLRQLLAVLDEAPPC